MVAALFRIMIYYTYSDITSAVTHLEINNATIGWPEAEHEVAYL